MSGYTEDDVKWVQGTTRANSLAHAIVDGTYRCGSTRSRGIADPVEAASAETPRCSPCTTSVTPLDCPDCGRRWVPPVIDGHPSRFCDDCVDSWHWPLVRDETTQVDIADRCGVGRSTVQRLVITRFPHWKAERSLQRAIDNQPHKSYSCKVCGLLIRQLESSRKVYCSDGCWEMWTNLRFHVDEDAHARHAAAVAKWTLANVDFDDPDRPVTASREHYEKVAAMRRDEIESQGRWLIEGSNAWKSAVEAVRRGLPIADELHPQIREQVEAYLYGAKVTA